MSHLTSIVVPRQRVQVQQAHPEQVSLQRRRGTHLPALRQKVQISRQGLLLPLSKTTKTEEEDTLPIRYDKLFFALVRREATFSRRRNKERKLFPLNRALRPTTSVSECGSP